MQTSTSPRGPSEMTGRAAIRFIGTATTLIRLGPFTILTDPNFLHRGSYAYLGYGVVSKRLTEPALQPEDLPALDLLLLSHLHGDHFDRVAMARLPSDVAIGTTGHAARALRRRGFRRAAGLANWTTKPLAKADAQLRVTAVPARHARGAVQAALPPVTGFVVDLVLGDGERAFRLYVSGDTVLVDDLAEIPRRFPGIDAALVHLGGTRILGLLLTMDAEQGVEFLRIVRPSVALPIHHDDYGVFRSPVSDFEALMAERLPGQSTIVLRRGEETTIEPRGV
jgi:L-ascorbate metabolism protein UlaG (beta-lactamase superfamily)